MKDAPSQKVFCEKVEVHTYFLQKLKRKIIYAFKQDNQAQQVLRSDTALNGNTQTVQRKFFELQQDVKTRNKINNFNILRQICNLSGISSSQSKH